MRNALLALLLAAGAAHAGGLSGQIDMYVQIVDEREALQDVAGVATLTGRYADLCDAEEEAAAPLAACASARDDIAGIVASELGRRLAARRVEWKPALPGHASASSARLRRLVALPPPPDEDPEVALAHPIELAVAAEGAVLVAGPRHSARVVGQLEPWTRVRPEARTGEWFRVRTAAGPAYLHDGLVDVAEDENEAAADAPPGSVKIADQKPTYYNTSREDGFPTSGPLYGKNYSGTERKTIRTPAGAKVADTSGRYFASLVMEGSGIIADGRGVSFVSNQRFQVLHPDCKGMTATGRWVVPFHTLAVNKREMPYGEVYWLPKTAGVVLPTGEVHDGFWFAHDTGSAFQGTPKHRTDFYVDRAEWVRWMELNVNPSFQAMPAFRVDAATKRAVYEKYKDQLGAPARMP